MMMDMKETSPPPPLEWHPHYRDMTWLLDWLHGQGPYAHMREIRISRPVDLAAASSCPAEMYPVEPPPEPIVITRHRAAGPAPYVGDPFHYEWPVGRDHLGRCVAGETNMIYERQIRNA
jgi:hypothetical protein